MLPARWQSYSYALPVAADDSLIYSCAARSPHGDNSSRWCNSEYEHWARIGLEHYDRATRKAAYAHIDRILISDTPEIFIWWPHALQLHSTDLHDFSEAGRLLPPYRWSI